MKNKKKGDCYRNSFNDFFNVLALDKKAVLVHGIAYFQKEKVFGGHAWIECFDHYVFNADNGKLYDREFFYLVGRIEYYVKYNSLKAIALAKTTEIYGPWDEKIKNSVHAKRGKKK